MILGIDEVGRGPWAGPLVVGAVVLPEGFTLEGLTDSKKLTAKKRALLNTQIREHALGWGLGWVHAGELDEIGLSAALKVATIRAVEAVKVPYHEIIIDGTINFLKETAKGGYVTTMPKADYLVPAVSAASVVAKVARDAYMEEQPFIAEWDKMSQTPNVVVVPFFISDGLHSYQDIPVMLGIESEVGAAASQRQIFRHNPHSLREKMLYYSSAIGTERLLADVILDQVADFDKIHQ
jgi:ribonuclease HII